MSLERGSTCTVKRCSFWVIELKLRGHSAIARGAGAVGQGSDEGVETDLGLEESFRASPDSHQKISERDLSIEPLTDRHDRTDS